ncbi:hypothetical protein C2E23DRAFT_718683 [Lenzites betulinus]|nr:hypothetical protein C2E23DRAFT_718683 [Lenzites betulinus]
MATDNAFPPAPPIDGEAMLEVFVHRSMKFTGAPLNDSIYGDGQRLAALGSKVVEAAYTDVYFNRKPMLRAEELKVSSGQLQEDVMTWVEAYKWRDKVRCTPGTDLKSSEETRLLFDSYAGAVFAGAGYKAVRDWISALVDPHAPPQAQPALAPEPDYKRVKVEPVMGAGMGYSPSYYPQNPQPYHYGQPPPPPPPASAPPPLPMQNPLSPAQPHSAFLPLFNQTAQQRRLEVQYPAMFSGPAHAGRWTVSCLVNGIEKGMGMGASKQLAKEEAARQAYYAMGWAPRECFPVSTAVPQVDHLPRCLRPTMLRCSASLVYVERLSSRPARLSTALAFGCSMRPRHAAAERGRIA